MGLKTELAPKGLEFRSSNFIMSDKYCTILSVISYPRLIAEGYLSSLTSMAGIKLIIRHMPVPFSTMQKMINKQVADLRQRYTEEHDKTLKERIRQDVESLEYFVSQLAASQSRIFDFQMHILVMANSEDDLNNKKIIIKNYLEAMDMRAIPLRFEQEKVLKSMLPIFPKTKEIADLESRIGTPMPSTTMAAMYPFIFDSIKDEGLSTLLGVDFSGGVILFNQFLYQVRKENNRNNANLIILGTSGSGKSTSAKLILRSHIRNDYQIVAIDPEGELEEMTRLYDGNFVDLGKGGEFGMINPLEIVIDADEEEIKQGLGYTVLTKSLQFLKAFMRYYDPSITEDLLTLFSEIVQDTYKRFGIDFNTDFSRLTSEDYPTFTDVYATIKGRLSQFMEKTNEQDILERLEIKIRPLTKELKYYFDGPTTITGNTVFSFLFKHKLHAYFNTLKNNAFLIFTSEFINSFILNTIK